MTYINTVNNATGRGGWDYLITSLEITCDIRAGYENQNCVSGQGTYTVGVRAKNTHGGSY